MIGVDLHTADQLLPRHCAVAVLCLSDVWTQLAQTAVNNCILFTAVADVAG